MLHLPAMASRCTSSAARTAASSAISSVARRPRFSQLSALAAASERAVLASSRAAASSFCAPSYSPCRAASLPSAAASAVRCASSCCCCAAASASSADRLASLASSSSCSRAASSAASALAACSCWASSSACSHQRMGQARRNKAGAADRYSRPGEDWCAAAQPGCPRQRSRCPCRQGPATMAHLDSKLVFVGNDLRQLTLQACPLLLLHLQALRHVFHQSLRKREHAWMQLMRM